MSRNNALNPPSSSAVFTPLMCTLLKSPDPHYRQILAIRPATSAARGAKLVDDDVLMESVRTVAERAQPVKRWDAKRRREVPVRRAAGRALAQDRDPSSAATSRASANSARDACRALHRRAIDAAGDAPAARADSPAVSSRSARSIALGIRRAG